MANRALIIRALCTDYFDIHNLSSSQDTVTLDGLLKSKDQTLDAGHAGTTFRFMTAYLALQSDVQILTGSDRMKERPIGELVTALVSIGAQIEYLEKEGYPPLKIHPPSGTWNKEVEIQGDISSQFISALLMIAPNLEHGLTIHIKGELVSRPYLEMTLKMMEYFGVKHEWKEQSIVIEKQDYKARDFHVEADWSSASYLYSLVALNRDSKLEVHGLSSDSMQGDSAIQDMSKNIGVISEFKNGVLMLTHNPNSTEIFEYNFEKQPDLAQTIACICAAKNIKTLFSGLKTLKIKETDRIQALKNELSKVEIYLTQMPSRFTKSEEEFYMQEGDYKDPEIAFETYKDHRMALAFSCFGCKSDIEIENPEVVKKSYVDYWKDLAELGFELEWID